MTSDCHAPSFGLDRSVTRATVGGCCVGLSRCPRAQAGQGCIRPVQFGNVGRPVDDQASRGRISVAFQWSGGDRDGQRRRRTEHARHQDRRSSDPSTGHQVALPRRSHPGVAHSVPLVLPQR